MRTNPRKRPGRYWPAAALTLSAFIAGTAYGQYLPGNVCQPGDPITASSANSPASEGVANAIDGTTAKYLNFDMANDTKTAGFVVSPSLGVTWVWGIAMETANDAPDRDAKEITLEGSNDDPATIGWTTGNWTQIAHISNIPAITNRYTYQTFYFTNFVAYRSYRFTVLHTQGNGVTPSTCCYQVAEVQLLGTALPKNVAQPGDTIFASSANSPASEGVANSIDGTTAKYLNFDMANDTKTAGFALAPSVGATLVNGVGIQTANDAPDRDVKEFTLEGSNDDTLTSYASGNWTQIAHVSGITAITNRYTYQYFLFDNQTPYKFYRWTVIHTQGNGVTPSTCCMQVAEVQLLGSGAPQNVLVPSDQIFASSANSPASEGVANAIDGTTAKYLNFDMANDTKTAGLAVTPSVGATVIIGVGIQTANDAPDRDVKEFTLEGSNDDTITDYTSGNWTQIAHVSGIPAITNRYTYQNSYFPNQLPYKHYRWTVIHTQGNGVTPSTCCMQVAEVQLLAVTAKADCTKAAFVSTPVDTPALSGSSADFFVEVNGPWPLQWMTNGTPVPGATRASFTTAPITVANAGITYSVAIVGCQTSAPVHALVFTPSATKSVGIQFSGGGANGTPEYMDTNDIAGVQLQAFFNIVTNSGSNIGNTGDGITSPDVLNNSDNAPSTITFEYATSGHWGVGVATESPTGRMLNGIAGANGPGGGSQALVFHNVPAGNHAVLVYGMSPPLQFQTVSYYITNIAAGTAGAAVYARLMNKDEYNPAPGFYRVTSTSAANPTVGNFIRFDGVQPDANGDVALGYDVLTGAAQATGVSAIQLVLNAPNPGSPPVITQDPQPAVAPAGGTVVLTVTASGNNLTYQWRKNGVNLSDAGHISGSKTASLTISQFAAADAGNYSVAVFNPAGSTVSKNAAVQLSNYNIQDRLAVYFKLNETGTATIAANSASNGFRGDVQGAVSWGPGKVGGAFNFDGFSSGILISNYTKPSSGMSVSAWAKIVAASGAQMTILRNADGGLSNTDGQFDLSFAADQLTGDPLAQVSLVIGADVKTITATTAVSVNVWHNVVFTADGAQIRLYVDGQLVATTDYLGSINATTVPWLSMGARMATDVNQTPPVIALDPTFPNALNGSLDEVALWTRPLSASEVGALFTTGSAGNELTSIVEVPPAGPPIVSVSHGVGTITVTWDHGVLTTGPTVNGPWTDTAFTSPHTEGTTNSAKYFRAHN